MDKKNDPKSIVIVLGHWHRLSLRLQGVLFPSVKRSEREADHSPPPSSKVKNVCEVISPLLNTSSRRGA